MHVVPFVQQQFQTLTGILLGSIMGSSLATLYKNEVKAVMMMMVGGGGEGSDNKVCLCCVCVNRRRERDEIDSLKCKSVYEILVLETK